MTFKPYNGQRIPKNKKKTTSIVEETTFYHLDPTLESYLLPSWISVSESGSFPTMIEIDIPEEFLHRHYGYSMCNVTF